MVEKVLPDVESALDTATLTPVVRRLLGDETAVLTAWSSRAIGYMAFDPAQRQVVRVQGAAAIGDVRRDWSLILKMVRSPAGADPFTLAPYDNDGRRERQFYESALPALIPGLSAPRLFGVAPRSDDVVWMWLEDVADGDGRHWPLARYAIVAHALGRFNGAYAGRVPPYRWLGLGRWGPRVATRPVFQAAGASIADDAVWRHPAVRHAYAGDAQRRIQQAWADHDWFWDITQSLPQTLCHHDVFRDNLFIRTRPDGEPEVVVIDWAMIGRGCLGAELAPLFCASIAYFAFPVGRARDLAVTAFTNYLTGLRDAGWHGNPDEVRLGFLATLAPWVTVTSGLRYFLDDALADRVWQLYEKSLPELRETWSALTLVLLDLLDEARVLAGKLVAG